MEATRHAASEGAARHVRGVHAGRVHHNNQPRQLVVRASGLHVSDLAQAAFICVICGFLSVRDRERDRLAYEKLETVMMTRRPMKNLMLYVVEDPKADLDGIRRLLELQVENSLDLGWRADDIILCTSFPFAFMGVTAIEVAADGRPRTARATSFYKTRCIRNAFDLLPEGGVFWYHDADAYQLAPITAPPSTKALAFTLYTTRERQLVQGGSMFFNAAARPIFAAVEDLLINHRCRKDEFALTDVVGRPEFFDAFDVLDASYNLGTTDFELRFQLAEQPIKVAHFHLGRPAHRAVFLEGGNSLGAFPLPDRFLQLLVRHQFVDPDELTRSLLERGRRAPDFEVSRDYGSTLWQSLRRRLPWGR